MVIKENKNKSCHWRNSFTFLNTIFVFSFSLSFLFLILTTSTLFALLLFSLVTNSFFFKWPVQGIPFSFFALTHSVSFKHPTKVCHHVNVPSSLVTILHYTYILMKSFSLFFTEVSKIRREVVEMSIQNTRKSCIIHL